MANAVLYVHDRNNYVKPIHTVHWYFADPSRFRSLLVGTCVAMPLTSAMQLAPTSISVDVQSSSWRDLLNALSTICPDADDQQRRFFAGVRYVSLVGATPGDKRLEETLSGMKKLCALEFYDTQLSDDQMTVVADLLKRSMMKAIGFGSVSGDQLNQLCKASHMNARVLRLAGPSPLRVSSLNALKVEMPCVELLALQDLRFDQRPISRIFFRGIGRFFPNLKCLLMDWNVVSPMVEFSELTQQVLDGLKDVYFGKKLQALAVLIYCPPQEDLRQATESITTFFSSDEKLKHKVHAFDFGLLKQQQQQERPPSDVINFRLILVGSEWSHFVQRLKKVIVDDRCTRPDLRHFCYMLDNETFSTPDLSLAFGGFDEAQVRAAIDSPANPLNYGQQLADFKALEAES